MTDKVYLEKLITLARVLERTAKARPYDSVAYEKCTEDLNDFACSKVQRRRPRYWITIICVSFVLCLVAFVAFCIMLPFIINFVMGR